MSKLGHIVHPKPDQSCEECFYAEWERTSKGAIKRNVCGRCKYPSDAIIDNLKLPKVVSVSWSAMAIWPKDGHICLCFKRSSADA